MAPGENTWYGSKQSSKDPKHRAFQNGGFLGRLVWQEIPTWKLEGAIQMDADQHVVQEITIEVGV